MRPDSTTSRPIPCGLDREGCRLERASSERHRWRNQGRPYLRGERGSCVHPHGRCRHGLRGGDTKAALGNDRGARIRVGRVEDEFASPRLGDRVGGQNPAIPGCQLRTVRTGCHVDDNIARCGLVCPDVIHLHGGGEGGGSVGATDKVAPDR